MSRRAIRPAGVVIGIIAATSLSLTACSVKTQMVTESCGPVQKKASWDGLDRCVLESQVRSQLAKKVGHSVTPVSCPDPLKAEVGSSTICTFTGAEGTSNVTVTVTSIDWGEMILDDGSPGNFVSGNAEFDLTVADKPNGDSNP